MKRQASSPPGCCKWGWANCSDWAGRGSNKCTWLRPPAPAALGQSGFPGRRHAQPCLVFPPSLLWKTPTIPTTDRKNTGKSKHHNRWATQAFRDWGAGTRLSSCREEGPLSWAMKEEEGQMLAKTGQERTIESVWEKTKRWARWGCRVPVGRGRVLGELFYLQVEVFQAREWALRWCSLTPV